MFRGEAKCFRRKLYGAATTTTGPPPYRSPPIEAWVILAVSLSSSCQFVNFVRFYRQFLNCPDRSCTTPPYCCPRARVRDYTGCNPGRRTSSFTRQPPDGAEIIGAQLVPSDLLHIGKDLRCPFQYSRPRQQDSANPFTPTRTLGYRAPYQKQTPGSLEYQELTMRVTWRLRDSPPRGIRNSPPRE